MTRILGAAPTTLLSNVLPLVRAGEKLYLLNGRLVADTQRPCAKAVPFAVKR